MVGGGSDADMSGTPIAPGGLYLRNAKGETPYYRSEDNPKITATLSKSPGAARLPNPARSGSQRVAEANAHLSLTAATAARVTDAIGAKPGDNGLADFYRSEAFPEDSSSAKCSGDRVSQRQYRPAFVIRVTRGSDAEKLGTLRHDLHYLIVGHLWQFFGIVIGHFLGPCTRTARLILARLQRQVLHHARWILGRLGMPPISLLAHRRSSFLCVRAPLAANEALNLHATGVRCRAP